MGVWVKIIANINIEEFFEYHRKHELDNLGNVYLETLEDARSLINQLSCEYYNLYDSDIFDVNWCNEICFDDPFPISVPIDIFDRYGDNKIGFAIILFCESVLEGLEYDKDETLEKLEELFWR
jgi:hypothetical protein